MHPSRVLPPPRRVARPSGAAGETVLLALAAPRPPLFALESLPRQRARLTLAGALRVGARPDGTLCLSVRTALGRWRAAPELERLGLLSAEALIECAIARAIGTCLGAARTTAAGTALGAADRAYAERRLLADLYPDARGTRSSRAVRAALFRQVADRTVLRAALLIFGRGATYADMADVGRAGARTLVRLCAETPNLAPLLADPVRRLSRKRAGTAARDLLGQIRQQMLSASPAERIAPRDWRWLSHQPRATVSALLRGAGETAAAGIDTLRLRLLGAAGGARLPAALVGLAAPGAALDRALAEVRLSACSSRLADLARLLRLAALEWTRRARVGASTRHIRDDFSYLIDWWIDASRAGAQVPHNATYASLIRRQQSWHQQMILAAPEFLQRWASALHAHESGGVRAVPLTDSLMLAREGMEMRHCVASYARDCAGGATRIFALEHVASGARATLEIRRRAGHWYAGQLKGPCNAEAPAALAAAAQRLAARYGRAEATRS